MPAYVHPQCSFQMCNHASKLADVLYSYTRVHLRMYTHKHCPLNFFHTHTQICTNSQAPYTRANTIHNSKQTVISRFQAASQFCSTLLLVCQCLWGGAAAVGFNKSIVFGSCLKGVSLILECCCCCCGCGCGRREGYCAGTWGRLGSVSLWGPPRTGTYCLIVSIYNMCVCVCTCSSLWSCKHMCKSVCSWSKWLTQPNTLFIVPTAVTSLLYVCILCKTRDCTSKNTHTHRGQFGWQS